MPRGDDCLVGRGELGAVGDPFCEGDKIGVKNSGNGCSQGLGGDPTVERTLHYDGRDFIELSGQLEFTDEDGNPDPKRFSRKWRGEINEGNDKTFTIKSNCSGGLAAEPWVLKLIFSVEKIEGLTD